MRTLVYDVAADSGGAATVLQSFYEEFKKDTENEYIFVLSVYELPETENIKVLNFPEVKKSMLHRLYFDHFVAHKLVKQYQADRVLSLQNIELPHAKVPQIVYEHNALPFSEYKFKPWEAFRPVQSADSWPDDEKIHSQSRKSTGADQLDEGRDHPSVRHSG